MKAFTCLILFISTVGFAQPESLVSQTRQLYEAFDTIDIDGITNMMCNPGDADEFAHGLDLWFQNDDFKFRYVFTNAKYDFNPQDEFEKLYAISFRNVIRITYFNPIDVKTKQEDLKNKFAATSIVYDQRRNCFLITYHAKLAARNTEKNKWQFTFADATIPVSLTDGCVPEGLNWPIQKNQTKK